MSPPLRAWDAPGWTPPPGAGARTLPARTTLPGIPERAVEWLDPGPRGMESLLDGLREAGAALGHTPVRELAARLGRVGRRFLQEEDPLRRRALEDLPSTAGISRAMARAVVDGMARSWTPAALAALLEAELGDPAVLDGWISSGSSGGPAAPRRRVRAFGPGLSVHVSAGTVPGVSVDSLLRGLLLRSGVLVKPGRGDVVLPLLFLRGLREDDPELARACAVLYWPGGTGELEEAVAGRADAVVVHGSDETVAVWRARLPARVRLVAHPHRISIAVVGPELAPDRAGGDEGTRSLARAVALFDQRGCVSPQTVWVEDPEAAGRGPREVAAGLAAALDELAHTLPSGVVEPEEAARLRQIRETAEFRRAAGEAVELWTGSGGPWTVVVDPEPDFSPGCLNRSVTVRPFRDLAHLRRILRAPGPWLQTAAVAGWGHRRTEVASVLAEAGAVRITSPSAAPWPPPWWHHDGRGPLRELIRWADLESDEEGRRRREPDPSGGRRDPGAPET